MAFRSDPVLDARPVGRGATLLLWGLGGLGLFLITALGTGRGLGPTTLAMLAASLVGILIVVRPEWGVVVLTSTFFLSYPAVLQGSGLFTINNVLGLMLAGLLAVRITVERRTDFLRNRSLQLFLLLTVALVVSDAVTPDLPRLPGGEGGSVPRLQELLTRTAYLVFFVAFIETRRQVLLLVWLVIGAVLLTVPSAIWNVLAADSDAVRAAATFGINAARNPNRLAFLCAMSIAILGHVVPEARSRLARIGGLLAIAVLTLTIFLSASRSGLIELVVLFVMFLIGLGGRHRRTRVFLLAMAVSIGIGLTLVPEHHFERMTNFFREERGESAASTRNRLELFVTGVRMFVDHPLVGVGLENFRRVSMADYGSTHASAVHNSYLLTLVEGGLLLFIPYMLILRSLWHELRRAGRLAARGIGPRLGWLVSGLQATFVLFLIFSFFADVWHELFLYLIAGLTITLGRLHRVGPGSTPAPTTALA